jgi:hypothetical protein
VPPGGEFFTVSSPSSLLFAFPVLLRRPGAYLLVPYNLVRGRGERPNSILRRVRLFFVLFRPPMDPFPLFRPLTLPAQHRRQGQGSSSTYDSPPRRKELTVLPVPLFPSSSFPFLRSSSFSFTDERKRRRYIP